MSLASQIERHPCWGLLPIVPAAAAGPRAPEDFLGNAYQTHPDPFGSDLELTQRGRCIAFEKIDRDHRPRAPSSPAENARCQIDRARSGLDPFDLAVAQRFSGSIAISPAHVAPFSRSLLAPDESR